jgi:hypothetical protein
MSYLGRVQRYLESALPEVDDEQQQQGVLAEASRGGPVSTPAVSVDPGAQELAAIETQAIKYWPVDVCWARERGWLRVRDPFTGQWHEMLAKEAPSGWSRLASMHKAERR